MTDKIQGYCEACSSKVLQVLLSDMEHQYTYENGLTASWKYSLVKCNSCGLVFITPKPSLSILQTFYQENYSDYQNDKINLRRESHGLKYKIASLRYASRQSAGISALLKEWSAILVELLTGKTISYTLGIPLQLAPDAQIFELGFGSGNWLECLSSIGYKNLHGYDIGSNMANIIRLKNIGIEISTGDFLRNYYPDDFFDLIRLEHVFEHLLEPIEVLKRIRRMLKPGGSLVMNFPSSEGLSFTLSPKHSNIRDSPRHLYLHTKKSARKMLIAAGFENISCRTYPESLDLQATINNILEERNWSMKWRFGPAIGPLYKMLSYLLARGDYITIMADK